MLNCRVTVTVGQRGVGKDLIVFTSYLQEEGPRTLREERPSQLSSGTDKRLDTAANNQNKVKSMATQLLAKFEENAPAPNTGLRKQVSGHERTLNSF